MSMDLEVWAEKPFSLPGQLPMNADWVENDGEWAFEQDEWQILVLAAQDEPPDDLRMSLPGAKHVVYVTLEPIGAPKNAYAMLERVVRALAKSGSGVWRDTSGQFQRFDTGKF